MGRLLPFPVLSLTFLFLQFSLHLNMAQECMAIFERDKLPAVANVEQVRRGLSRTSWASPHSNRTAPRVLRQRARHPKPWSRRWCPFWTAAMLCALYDVCGVCFEFCADVAARFCARDGDMVET